MTDLEVTPTGRIANPMVPMVSGNTFIKLVIGYHRQKLSKDSFPMIHDLDAPSRQMEYTYYGGALLLWHNRPLSDLVGTTISLRFYFRDARIYDLRWNE